MLLSEDLSGSRERSRVDAGFRAVFVQRGEPDLPPAQVGDHGDEVLQGPRQPVQRRHDQGVAGGHELQARGQLRPVGVPAGELLGEHPPAAGGAQRVELPLQLLPAGGDPGVADPDLGQQRRLGHQQLGRLPRARHTGMLSENGSRPLLNSRVDPYGLWRWG